MDCVIMNAFSWLFSSCLSSFSVSTVWSNFKLLIVYDIWHFQTLGICFCICERELLSTREKCHATCCYAEEDLPNLAVFVHAMEMERREACGANNSSSFVAGGLITVTPWWQSNSKHDEIRTFIYSCGSWVSPYKSELKKTRMFLYKTKRSLNCRCRQVSFSICQGRVFNIFTIRLNIASPDL